MKTTPKSLRLQIALFGRTNVGKSSFLNMIAGQDISIISNMPGTTTDIVEKSMELLPIGPVVILDTAGIDDTSQIAEKRIEKTDTIFSRADIAVLITDKQGWTKYEQSIAEKSKKFNIPLITVINKSDLFNTNDIKINDIDKNSDAFMFASSIETDKREEYVNQFKTIIANKCPQDFLNNPALLSDILPPGEVGIMIVPIDIQAPKGRLILPQVQAIRDALDNDSAVLVVKEREFLHVLENFKKPPALVICDSQVVLKMTADTPSDIPCTTFSILFARYKGDLPEMVKGAKAIDKLQDGDKILIAESCSHHAAEDDIGRVKIPRWLRQYTGADLEIDVCAGRDFPKTLTDYKLIIQCGSCMLTRKETLNRIQQAKENNIPITNYGVCISMLQGVLKRVITPFPSASLAFDKN